MFTVAADFLLPVGHSRWQFHQVVVGIVYYLMLIPMWSIRAQTSGSVGALLFFSAVAAVGVAATLRFNLWFTSRFYRNELNAQRGRVFGR